MVVNVTSVTLEDVKIRPHFPVNFSPGDPVSLSDKSHELFEVPNSIHNMFSSDLTVIINITFGLTAVKHFPLTHCEQLVAICTFV